MNGILVGELRRSARGLQSFAYGDDWLDSEQRRAGFFMPGRLGVADLTNNFQGD